MMQIFFQMIFLFVCVSVSRTISTSVHLSGLLREFFIRHVCTDNYGDCCIFSLDVGQELGDKTRFISAVRRRASTEDMDTHSETHDISFPVVFWSVFRLFVSCLFEYELYRSVIVSLFLSLYVSLYVCASFMRGWGWAYLFRSLKVERSDITQPILCTERQMENPRFILALSSSPTHMVNKGQQVLKGPSIFKLPSWYRNVIFAGFFLVLSCWIVILSTDIRLSVKKWGVLFFVENRV